MNLPRPVGNFPHHHGSGEAASALGRRLLAAADFRRRFTSSRRVPTRSFEPALFFECAPLHVLAVTLFCDRGRIALLAPDCELIRLVADARCLAEVDRAIDEHCRKSTDDGWWRRVGAFRICTRRLRRIAQRCLPPHVLSS
jgi:hypothetical protein